LDLGERILQIRKSLKLTQKEFANQLRIDKGHVANIEKNSRRPSEHLLHLVCLKYSVSENWLLTGQGEMFTPPEEAFQNLYKTLTARHGERAVMNALHNIIKEHGLVVAAGRQTHRPDTGDPELDRLIDTLYDLWTSGNADMKGWIKVQFNRAFPEDVIEEVQKKQKESLGQASVS